MGRAPALHLVQQRADEINLTHDVHTISMVIDDNTWKVAITASDPDTLEDTTFLIDLDNYGFTVVE